MSAWSPLAHAPSLGFAPWHFPSCLKKLIYFFLQVATDPTAFPESEYGAVIDDAWIIQTRPHGPFDAALAPSGLAVPTGNHTREMQVEHWWHLLDLEDGSGRRTEAIIATLVLKKSTSAF